jgi:hypothetical protein
MLSKRRTPVLDELLVSAQVREDVRWNVESLRRLLNDMVRKAYPAVLAAQTGAPALSDIRIVIAFSEINSFEQFQKDNAYREFIMNLWTEIVQDPRAEEMCELWHLINEPEQVIWVGLGVDIPEPEFSKLDQRLLKKAGIKA